ncbi:Na+/H+ antiporter subunit D [Rubritalea tangerina]|uniref:Na+/H+ antiporter subunit D n=1 Tax=Rubritalea tangerina TaxID=430798 RepID=A0ABW4Z625_9BACT
MIWLVLSLFLPFITALACLHKQNYGPWVPRLSLIGAVVQLGSAVMLVRHVIEHGYTVIHVGGWQAPFGISLVADLFSAMMVAVTGVIGVAVAAYSMGDIDMAHTRKHYYSLIHLLLMGVNGSFLTGDLFNLYVWFEVMLLASFVLITLTGTKDQLEGGVKYLLINILSSVLFLCGVGLIYGKLGTLNMADIAMLLKDHDDALLVNSSAMLLLVAFGIKAGLFPFFFWLPASYHTPKISISAIFAGLLTKVGVYALIRSYTLLFNSQFDVVQDVLLFLAGMTMLTGVFGAASHFDIKKILSFHIVSQIGYIVMGLAIGTPVAIAGAIFYTIHHILVKTNLFLIAGLIEKRNGTTDLKKLGGLYKATPGLALLFFLPAFSLGGIPPLSGFWAKLGVIKAGLDTQHYWLVGCALFVGILTLYSMTKIWAEAFWKKQPPMSKEQRESCSEQLPMTMVIPCVGLAVLTVWISLNPQPLLELAQIASEQLADPQEYIDQVLTTNPEVSR